MYGYRVRALTSPPQHQAQQAAQRQNQTRIPQPPVTRFPNGIPSIPRQGPAPQQAPMPNGAGPAHVQPANPMPNGSFCSVDSQRPSSVTLVNFLLRRRPLDSTTAYGQPTPSHATATTPTQRRAVLIANHGALPSNCWYCPRCPAASPDRNGWRRYPISATYSKLLG